MIGDCGTRLQRNESIVVARVDHIRSELLFEEFAQTERHIQHQIFLLQALRANSAGIVAAMAGIDHDFADFQT